MKNNVIEIYFIMKAYKFDTKILKDGVIKIPGFSRHENQEIEIFIITKKNKRIEKKMTAEEFIKKWAGFLSQEDVDKSKYEYLSKKYK